MNEISKKSKTKIMVVKESFTTDEYDQEKKIEEGFAERAVKEYTNLQQKCEEVILRIKKRKQQQEQSNI